MEEPEFFEEVEPDNDEDIGWDSCHYCGEEFPMPVEYYHSEEECAKAMGEDDK